MTDPSPAEVPPAEAEADGLAPDEGNDPGEGNEAGEEDRVAGIALSGGGIRSATFNLGVLQVLNDFGMLEKFDYLTTVSGGGYIGSWWTRYRARYAADAEHEEKFFPKWKNGETEPDEITHLRKFSNFIVPRMGLTLEMGKAVVTAFSGVIQSLVAVNAALILVLLSVGSVLDAYRQWYCCMVPAWPNLGLQHPGVVFLYLAIVAVLFRLVVQRRTPEGQSEQKLWIFNVVQGGFLLLAGILGIFELIWFAARNVSEVQAAGAAVGAVAASGVFAYLMKRVSQITKVLDKAEGLKRRLLTPKILAYVIVILGLVAWAYLSLKVDVPRFWQAVVVTVILVLALLLFHPRRVGLHAFYRSRLSRAYLGDHRSTSTMELDGDDIALTDLRRVEKPEHLICVAANDLKSDTLHNFDRGAFHGVLSAKGFHVGRGRQWKSIPNDADGASAEWKQMRWRRKDITLGGAMTTSAAAFNSVMGSKSKNLGWAVSLVLTALNLRLGLWLPNPARPGKFQWGPIIYWLPGLLFFAEAVSWVYCRIGSKPNRYLHLSDGAHFENLAVYELIRRECRYVLVVDCGADSKYEFEDLGNLIRRVRVDFGVDIRIDTSALKPDENGISREHFAVGTIRYARGNRGVILYVKPSLTGDEPGDVRHYARKHPSFPHESTGDQFYNEAQWEAYRRLGFHTAHHAFDFLRDDKEILEGGPSRIFSEARWRWTKIPAAVTKELTRLERDFDAMQRRWIQEAPAPLGAQVFPEAFVLGAEPATPEDNPLSPKTVSCLLELLLFLNELYHTGELETYGWTGTMRGWRNIIQRWTRIDALETWWPVLRSLFGSRFVDYMESETPLGPSLPGPDVTLDADCDLLAASSPIERAYRERLEGLYGRAGVGPDLRNLRVARLSLRVNLPAGWHRSLPIGMLAYELDDSEISWQKDHLFILPGLWGSDWGTKLIGEFLKVAGKAHAGRRFKVSYGGGSRAQVQPIESLLTMYAPHGFRLNKDEKDPALERLPLSAEELE